MSVQADATVGSGPRDGRLFLKRYHNQLRAIIGDAAGLYLISRRFDGDRLGKLIESSSMFRQTLRGRFVLDILRTVFQTAVAARAPL